MIYYFFVGRLGMLFPAIMVMGVVISYAFSPIKQYDNQRPFDVSFDRDVTRNQIGFYS